MAVNAKELVGKGVKKPFEYKGPQGTIKHHVGEPNEKPIDSIIKEGSRSIIRSNNRMIAYETTVGLPGIVNQLNSIKKEGNSWTPSPEDISDRLSKIEERVVRPSINEKIIYVDSASKDSRSWGTRPPKP